MLKIIDKRCMGMKNPLGIRMEQVDFSWRVESDMNDTVQETYRLVISEADGGIVWDSGICKSSSCRTVFCPADNEAVLRPRTCYEWIVRITDNYGNCAVKGGDLFETGFIEEEKWQGQWISPIQDAVDDAFCDWPKERLSEHFGPVDFVGLDRGNTEGTAPAYYMRRTFRLKDKAVRRGRLYMTAGGIYDAYINGSPVTDTLLNPGFTPYDKYFEYQTYDITNQLDRENVIGVILADGWYKGRNGIGGLRNLYGKRTKLLAELHVIYEDGEEEVITSDALWRSAEGPYVYADLFVGEYYDAQKEIGYWNTSGFDAKDWTGVLVSGDADETLKGVCAPPVRAVRRISPVSLIKNETGETILDMGQNMAGYVKATFYHMKPGTEIIFEHTEMLDENGHYMNSINPECREMIDHYICRGGKTETYCPRFTFHGFRYVRITGLKDHADAGDFEGIVLASDLEETIEFKCDNEDINRLQSNIYWSQLGNFLCIPTDCPQREKAGWTGDVFVYSNTAAYVQDVRLFLKKWLEMVRLEQFDNGIIPVTVPYTKNYYYIQDYVFKAHTSCGWGDAIVEVPWVLYMQYGDRSFLSDNYEAMYKWMKYVEKEASEGRKENYDSFEPERQKRQKYLWNTGFHYGDWSYPSCRNERGETDNLQSSINTREYVATAIYAHSCEIFANAAGVLGETDTERYYRVLKQNIVHAFEDEYIQEDGSFSKPIQGLYVLALAMGMVSGEKAECLAGHLNRLIIENGYCLDTGFMSVKFLPEVLCRFGYSQTAEKLLLQEKCPSWLYEVKRGATTVWSKWNAIQPENGKVTCASYNHYSFGSIGKWIYSHILGISEIKAGFQEFYVSPGYQYSFHHVKGCYRSCYGSIEVDWKKDGKERSLDLAVPVSAKAVVELADCDLSSLDPCYGRRLQDGRLILGSGRYHISYRTK